MLKFSSKFLLVVFMDESLLLFKRVGACLDFEDFIFDPCLYIISWLLVRFQMILSQDQCQKAHHKFCFSSFILFTWFRICFSKNMILFLVFLVYNFKSLDFPTGQSLIILQSFSFFEAIIFNHNHRGNCFYWYLKLSESVK